MSKIEKPLFRATVAETSDLASNTGQIISKTKFEDPYLKTKGEELNQKGNEMTSAIATDKAKAKTAELVEKDNKRDSLFASLKLFLRAHIKWDLENQALLAKRIYEIIKKHGLSLDTENYEEESSLLESLIEELLSPANAEAIQGLGLTKLVNHLNDAQKSFKVTFLESIEIEAAKENVVPASTLKRSVYDLLGKTINYLNAMNEANPGQYGEVSAEIAELVGNLNKKIRSRR